MSKLHMMIVFASATIASIASESRAQTASQAIGIAQRATRDDEEQKALPTNPWVGAQIGYAFGDGSFGSNLVTSGSIMYLVRLNDDKDPTAADHKPHFSLPVRGNIGPLVAGNDKDKTKEAEQKLLTSADGFRVSLEPKLQFVSERFFRASILGTAGWKLNVAKDANDTTRYLAAGRFSFGTELLIGRYDGEHMPISLALSAVTSTFANDTWRKVDGLERSYNSAEFTLVVPTGNNTGLLTEAIATQGTSPVWRIGLMVTGSNAK